ncbi:hypothetical protein Vadar_005379 [Vaccinium darrowii]|uniref:Uncharacterized protein n=1 Tax=Vaccinium darrowii TaxID=229202 RepID=A0ACB7YU37_9ERIC|nr:hypothetical protein Vadar_005379 [Vaccinium darrowii]
MDATQDSVVLPWIVGLSSFVCSQGGTKSMDATSGLFHLFCQEILDDATDIDLVVNLKLPENVLLEKCLGRRICSERGKNFNVASINVQGENGRPGISMAPLPPPPQCASKLITRSDDTEAVVKERLRVYNEKVHMLLTRRPHFFLLHNVLQSCYLEYSGLWLTTCC